MSCILCLLKIVYFSRVLIRSYLSSSYCGYCRDKTIIPFPPSTTRVEFIYYPKLENQGRCNLQPFNLHFQKYVTTICYTSGTIETQKGVISTMEILLLISLVPLFPSNCSLHMFISYFFHWHTFRKN